MELGYMLERIYEGDFRNISPSDVETDFNDLRDNFYAYVLREGTRYLCDLLQKMVDYLETWLGGGHPFYQKGVEIADRILPQLENLQTQLRGATV